MILAAGFGKRLKPLTLKNPKPLLKIGQETLLSNTLKFLIEFGVKEVVINVHYLEKQIVDYINKNQFSIEITIIKEKDNILDTGGGILNAINYFDEAFLCINPDTIWNTNYIKDLESMTKEFLLKNSKCSMMLVDKNKSFDRSFKGDFNLENYLINRKNKNLKYIFTGVQIIKPELFAGINDKVFSINKIWNKLIENDQLHGFESNVETFLHVSNLDIYNKLIKIKH